MQVKSHLLHLREGYIEARRAARPWRRSWRRRAPAFAALLRNVARLHRRPYTDRMEATRQGARAAGLPDDIVDAVLALEHPAHVPDVRPGAAVSRDYLAAVERLARPSTDGAWTA